MSNHPNRANVDRTLADAVRDYRDRLGMNNDELAMEWTIPERTLEKWLEKTSGKSSMSRVLVACLDQL